VLYSQILRAYPPTSPFHPIIPGFKTPSEEIVMPQNATYRGNRAKKLDILVGIGLAIKLQAFLGLSGVLSAFPGFSRLLLDFV
jgi:hypothetical protein